MTFRINKKILLKILQSHFVSFIVSICILLSVSSVVLGSFEEFAAYHRWLNLVTYLSSLIFFVEYNMRLYVAPLLYPGRRSLAARCRYAFSFYGFIDFVAILPFILNYIYWGTTSMHLIILPYILVVLKVIRYSRSFQLIAKVIYAVKSELFVAYTACSIMICFSAILMYYIERNAQPEVFDNIGSGFWWAVVTFTTVGYGDIYPVTIWGRLLGGFISMIGIAMIAIPTGIISSAFIRVMQENIKKEQKD